MIDTVLNQRFEITAELGRGGTGIVYCAHDIALDRDVAVKVLSQLNLSEPGKEKLIGEAQAIAKMNHPNIVAVHDVGETDESPYIVMEYVEGQNLHDASPKVVEDIVEIAAQICLALDHAHSHGIVHRDLKPENIIVDADGTAKLMDFGIARSMASRLTSEGQVVGTVFYLAPEIALGQQYDGRADLYSLGVMLYELVTGRLPFADGDPVAVISQHLHASVVPPRAKNPEVPPLLDTLIVQLMSKDPDGRPSTAAETHRMLERENLLDPEAMGEREVLVLDRIVRGRFVGRDQELSEARSLWSEAVAGEGQMLLVSGDPGVGKTRLMRELSTHVEITGGRALVGFCYEEGGAPYAPFAQVLRKALRAGNKNGFHLPNFVLADLLDLAPELKPYYPDVPANPGLEPDAEQQRLFENVVAFCSEVSEAAPLLLVLEDVHWADSGSLSLMRHLARRIRRKPMLMLATYREIELDAARPFREVMLTLNRERLARRMKLNRLSVEQTAALLSVIFQDEISQEFLDGIYHETEGNPFFIEEVCKALLEEGQVFHTEDGWDRLDMDEMEIPQSVRDVVQARAAKLPQPFQEALTLAAILGREFDFDTLVEASGLDEDTLIEALEAAEDAQLIQEVSGEGGATFSFVHALIPSTLVESVRTLRRRKLHERAAEAIESSHPEDYESLAQHYEEAGDEGKALSYYTRAAERASAAFSNHDAQSHFEAALDLVRVDQDRAELLSELGVVLARQGQFDLALVTWRDAIALFRSFDQEERIAWCFARMTRAYSIADDWSGGLEVAKQGLSEVGDAVDSAALADLLHEAARAYFFKGYEEEATPLCLRALQMSEATGAIDVQAEALITIGIFQQPPVQEAISNLEAAVQLSSEYELPVAEARARNNLASVLGPSVGDIESARKHLLKAAELARMTGNLAWELFFRSNEIAWAIGNGELSYAEHELADLRELSESAADTGVGERQLLSVEAFLLRAQGNSELASERMRMLLQKSRSAESPLDIQADNVWLAENLTESGEYDEALDALEEAVLISDQLENGRAWSRSHKALTHAKRGDSIEARSMIDETKEFHRRKPHALTEPILDRAEGLLAVMEHRWSDAWTAFESAIIKEKGFGQLWWRLLPVREWAEAHIVRADAGDYEDAAELLLEAYGEYEDMDAPGYVELIQGKLDELNRLQG